MKNPFEFAKELLRYTRGELSKEEEKGIEQVLLEVKGMNTLVEELKDKDRIEYEMHIIAKFNTEKALSKLKNRKQVKRRGILSWIAAASVVVIAGVSAWILLSQEPDVDNLSVTEKFEPGKAIVTLEMASGLKYRLDTLSSVVRNNRVNVAFDNNDGVLKIKEQDSLADGATKEIGYNTVNVPYGGTYTVELCDGTKVYLNSGTTLEFPSRFDGKVRSVILKGEAYFDVARNVSKPFVVEVDEMKVKVLGTSFNVKSYVDEPGVYTTLVEGSVAILRDGQPKKKIKPGEQAYYNKGVGTLSIAEVDVKEFTSWKDGVFYFKDIALEEILRIVSRWYDLEVFYMNQGAKSVIYSGKLPMYSSVEDVLRKFEISGDVRFELKGRTLTVFDK
ncbi:MAG: FecR domain-containing protein [Porphyromonadaceae bacterium]|uniref:FecR family protein n=1 Tax=Butyricimonas virosa TaxID=544645 RepID=UPI002666AA5E|nr:FecR family protein [Butyricimonas virosa]MBS5626374.1 FecR domain-containing protein [Porphyromonadaceae bacterium]